MPVDDQEPRYRLAIQDVDGNIVDRLGTLYAEPDGTLKIQEGSGSFNEASLNPDGTFSVPTAPVNADEVARKQEIDGKADTPHDLGGGDHSADTLENLNSKVSDATLDDTDDPREPEAHSDTHENNGPDEMSVAGLSGELSDPQPSQTQDDGTDVVASPTLNFGNALEVDDDNGVARVDVDTGVLDANVPNWEEDGNSPVTQSDTDSVTYTLGSNYDVVKIFVKFGAGPFATTARLQVNNDTASNYDYVEMDGTTTISENSWELQTQLQNDYSGDDPAVFTLAGRWEGAATVGQSELNIGGTNSPMQAGSNTAVASPLTQFTIFEGSSDNWESVTIQVFGRDIA